MNFIALDVETANSDPKSICQIGLAVFENGVVVDTWKSLINPNVEFDGINIAIHGIEPKHVKNAPSIEEVRSQLEKIISDKTVATYTAFDRVAFNKNFDDLNWDWLDVALVVRRTWEEVAYRGYGLANICSMLDIRMDHHHDALSDAICAGRILIEAGKIHGDLNSCKKIVKSTISTLIGKGKLISENVDRLSIFEGGNPEGKWYGDVLCFTGELAMPRVQASIIASQLGFNVGSGVTKKTNFLVKGRQDDFKLNGKRMSSKEEKALSLMRKDQDIMIISEADFFELIKG